LGAFLAEKIRQNTQTYLCGIALRTSVFPANPLTQQQPSSPVQCRGHAFFQTWERPFSVYFLFIFSYVTYFSRLKSSEIVFTTKLRTSRHYLVSKHKVRKALIS